MSVLGIGKVHVPSISHIPILLCACVSLCVYDRGKGDRQRFATQRFGGKDTLGRLGSPSQLLVGAQI